jgi:hypothetical protein
MAEAYQHGGDEGDAADSWGPPVSGAWQLSVQGATVRQIWLQALGAFDGQAKRDREVGAQLVAGCDAG